MFNGKVYTKTLLLILLLFAVFFSSSCATPQRRAPSQDQNQYIVVSGAKIYMPPKMARSETYYRDAVIPAMPAKHGRLIFYTTEKFPSPLTTTIGGPIGVMLTLNGQDAFVVDLPAGWFTVKEDIMASTVIGQSPSYNTVFKLDTPLGFSMYEGETKYIILIRTSTNKWIVQLVEENSAKKELQKLIYSGRYIVP